ncbi:MAG: hypothetical protein ACXVAX_02205 [Pseudobdellovibrio sp.]
MRSLILITGLALLSLAAQAQQMWGSGYMSGLQTCPQNSNQNMFGPSSNSSQNDQKTPKAKSQSTAEEKSLKSKKAEREQLEAQTERLKTRLERYFASDVIEFLVDTHIEGAQTCDRYSTFHAADCNVTPQKSDCSAYLDVPDLLKNKWTTKDSKGRGNYCTANSRSSGGNVSAEICKDEDLRPRDSLSRRSSNSSECAKNINDYRKKRIQIAKLADDEEKLQDQIDERKFMKDSGDSGRMASGGFGERGGPPGDFQGGPPDADGAECEDCLKASRGYQYQQSSGRDWTSSFASILGGLGLMYVGKQAENSANEQAAQLGYPSTQSYGYPYYAAGVYGIINGLSGSGSFGCGQTLGAQSGMSMNQNSGAFGYPVNYSGSYSNYANYNPNYFTGLNYGATNPYLTQMNQSGLSYNTQYSSPVNWPTGNSTNLYNYNSLYSNNYNNGYNNNYYNTLTRSTGR